MTEKRALLITYSDVASDSRVRRQIGWLADDGWTIDTLGLGEHPSAEVRDHFELEPQARWVRTRVGGILNYGILPRRLRFRHLMLERIPAEARRRIREGQYELIVFEEYDFLPLLTVRNVFSPAALNAHLHLDMHEYRDRRLTLNSIRRILGDSYYRWRRSLIGHRAFNTRTTVASRIADFYVEDFGFERPAIVRNCPPYTEQVPTPVDPTNIKLLFHGMASWARGFHEILNALDRLDDRFTMTFMLTGDRTIISTLEAMTERFGQRARIVPAVPMTEVPHAVNEYDLEIIFLPPLRRNLEFALPNKFFEAVQGRLGVVIGRSPMMEEIVREFGNGIVVDGWSGEDLANALSALTPERVDELKRASHAAAAHLSAEHEGSAFLAAIGSAGNPQ